MKKELPTKNRDKMEIPTRLYSGLVRSLSWKIEYHSRILKALDFIDCLDSLDGDQFYHLEKILKGEL